MQQLGVIQVGQICGDQTVLIERGPVVNFARAIGTKDPAFLDARCARAEGLDDLVVTATFPFVMGYWGALPELQDSQAQLVPDDPNLSVLGPLGSVVLDMMTELGPGAILHARQGFVYHEPLRIGALLRGVSKVSDVRHQALTGRNRWYVTITTNWIDAGTDQLVVTSTFCVVHIGARSIPSGSTTAGASSD